MGPNKSFYKVESAVTPAVSHGKNPAAEPVQLAGQSGGCKRRVIEVRVPSNTSSGCANCYPNAEIHACTGSFTGSKIFEEYCRVPSSSTSEAECKTFKHTVEVYKKPAGASEFAITPIKSFVYSGFMQDDQCRVAAKYLGQIHDTAEVYPSVLPPSNGTDTYRVTSYPAYNGNTLPTVVFVEYENMQ